MKFSSFIFLLCVGVLGCGSVTESKAVTELNKGVAFIEEEDWPTAIACFTEAIRLDPDDAKAYHNRGIAYEYQGNKAKAEADYAKYEELK